MKEKEETRLNISFIFFALQLLRKLSIGHKIQLCLFGKDSKQFFLPSYWPNLLLFSHTTEVVNATHNTKLISKTCPDKIKKRKRKREREREIVCDRVCVYEVEREREKRG